MKVAENVTADLHHGGNRVDSVHVLHEAFYEVADAQADGPVGVTLQPDHLVGTETVKTTRNLMSITLIT